MYNLDRDLELVFGHIRLVILWIISIFVAAKMMADGFQVTFSI